MTRLWLLSAAVAVGTLATSGTVRAEPPDAKKEQKGAEPTRKKRATKDGKDNAKSSDRKSASKGIEPGDAAPDFTLTASDGKKYKFSDYKDKIVVIAWYNYECPYIKRYGAKIQELCDKYTAKGVVWLAIDSTGGRTQEQNAEHLKKTKRTFPILLDPDGKVGHAYDAKTTPHMFVISKGKLAYKGALFELGGDHQWTAEAADALLAGKTVSKTTTRPFG